MKEKGFTLTELMVVMAISAILAGMLAYSAIIMRRSLERDRRVIDVQLNLSRAMNEILSNLSNAGFGIDARFTFDVDVNNDGIPDSDGGADGTDELRFVFREPDPRFYWQVRNLSCDTITLYADAMSNPVNLTNGSILFVQNQNSTKGTFVRVNQNVVNGSGNIPVALAGLNSPVNYHFCSRVHGSSNLSNVVTPLDPDFNAGNSVAMLVRYFRYFIQNSPAGIPSLYLDPVGPPYNQNIPPILIAEGIEDLQVEYVLAGQINNMVSIDSVTPLYSSQGGTFENLTLHFPVPDSLNAPYNDPERMLNHPSNIRKVYITLVGRSREDLGVFVPRPAVANHINPAGSIPGTLQTNDNFFRDMVRAGVVMRNLLSTSFFRIVKMSIE